MILLGRYLSPFVRRVAATLELYGLPFENNPLQHTGDDAPKLRELNPVGRVPALILDDERIIVDSHIILDYLDRHVGPDKALTPVAGEERDRVEQVNAYALWCVEREMWAEARTHLEQAVARDSLASSLHNNLGILYERLGEPVKARAAYERALVLQPGKGAYQSNLRRLDGADVSHSEDDKEHLRRRSDYDQSGDQTDDLFRMVHD